MTIDKVFILAAGFGRRMGAIGEQLPKVLWPIFDLPLLELQVLRALEWRPQQIYINLHHQADLIKATCERRPVFQRAPITWLEERPQILGVGGAIHQLQKLDALNGTLLVTAADQFLFFSPQLLQREVIDLTGHRACLFSCLVPAGLGFNQIVLDDHSQLSAIKPAPKDQSGSILTYSGMGLINLDGLPHRPGPSAFFDSVADYRNESIRMILPPGLEYWDFGTLERYVRSHFDLLQQAKGSGPSAFRQFLERHRALDPRKIDHAKLSYGKSLSARLINLTDQALSSHIDEPVMVLAGDQLTSPLDKKGVYYNRLHESI